MNIQQRLMKMADDIAAQDGLVSEKVDICRQAADRIDQLEQLLERQNAARFDRFFAAALQGILAGNKANIELSDKMNFVYQARLLARVCIEEKP
jgi:hypothetical protein